MIATLGKQNVGYMTGKRNISRSWGVEIPLVASCYRNRDKLRPGGPHLARMQTLPLPSEIFGKWSEIFGKWSQTPSSVCIIKRTLHVSSEIWISCSRRSLVRYCSCHSNIKLISSRHREISSMHSSPSTAVISQASKYDQLPIGLTDSTAGRALHRYRMQRL